MFRGIALKLASTLAFIAMSTQVKLVAGGYPLGEVIFCRAFFAMIPLVAWLGMRGELLSCIIDTRPSNHIRRCMAGATGMFFSFGALTNLPLPDATAISYVTPILTTASTPKGKASVTSVSVKQSYSWVSIILAVVLFFAVMSLLLMDSGAEKDTILYAKFLRVGEVGGQ
jgi:drug/metabolite transporter (DMT)-like permease